MTAYELLSMNALALKAMCDKSLNVSDIKYLDLYKEYSLMTLIPQHYYKIFFLST